MIQDTAAQLLDALSGISESGKRFDFAFNDSPKSSLEFEELESLFGWRLPPDLAYFVKNYHGQAERSCGACFGLRFCSIDDMEIAFAESREGEYREPPFDDCFSENPYLERHMTWQPQWIPVAVMSNFAYMFLDPGPSPLGVPGQIFVRDWTGEMTGVFAVGFENLLRRIIGIVEEQTDMPSYLDVGTINPLNEKER